MEFLQYLLNKDKNRQRKKANIMKLLYFLVPLFLISFAYTNEVIIDKCEDIHYERTLFSMQIDSLNMVCNKTEQSLNDRVRKLFSDNKDIETALLTLEKENKRVVQERIQLEKANKEAVQKINELTNIEKQLAKKLKQVGNSNTSLGEKLDIANEEIAVLQKEKGILTNFLRDCKSSDDSLSIKLMSTLKNERKLKGQISNLNKENSKLMEQLKSPVIDFKKVRKIPAIAKKEVLDNCNSYEVKINGKIIKHISFASCSEQ